MTSSTGAPGPLTRVGDSTLYACGGGATWVFLLWDSDNPPASITLDDTWAEAAPRRSGWYVFLPAAPNRASAPELERDLRDVLAAPAATGLVWAGWTDGAVDLRGTVAVTPDADGRRVVAADAPIRLPPGLLSIGFVAGMRVDLTQTGSGGPVVIVTHPAGEDQPRRGIEVPLTGTLAGCLTFTALLEAGVEGDRTTKFEAEVRVDPLRPFDPHRTRTSPTGAAYVLIAEAHDAYRLVPVAADRARDSE